MGLLSSCVLNCSILGSLDSLTFDTSHCILIGDFVWVDLMQLSDGACPWASFPLLC